MGFLEKLRLGKAPAEEGGEDQRAHPGPSPPASGPSPHPAIQGFRLILERSSDLSRYESELAAALANAGPQRELNETNVATVFSLCMEHTEGGHGGASDELPLLTKARHLVSGAAEGTSIDAGELRDVAPKVEALYLSHKAEATEAEKEWLAKMKSDEDTTGLAARVNELKQSRRAAQVAALGLAALGYFRGLQETWATGDAQALERALGFAGQESASALSLKEETNARSFIRDLVSACHERRSPSA